MVFHQIAIARHLRCALVSSFFGFIVLAVGIFSPAWLSNLGQNNCTVQEGIWFSRACHSAGGPCIISSREWILQEYGVVRKHPGLMQFSYINYIEFTISLQYVPRYFHWTINSYDETFQLFPN